MEMRKCKECGKLFMPKSMRSQYCDALHYRPCPVCGKPVEAKYLSDPPRCCSKECQQASRAKNKSQAVPASISAASTIQIDTDEGTTCVNVISLVDRHNIASNLSEEGKRLVESGQPRTFVGKSSSGFCQGHTYMLEINQDGDYGTYIVSGYYDLTEDKSVAIETTIASKLSFNQFFIPTSKQIVLP